MMTKFFILAVYFLAHFGLGNTLIASESTKSNARAIRTENNLQNLNSIVDEVLNTFNVPGMAIGVIVDGKIIVSKGYGFRNLEQGLPVNENTLFAIGSCTKAFTTLLLGQLVDENKIGWDDLVIDIIPEFRLIDPYTTRHLTIRDLVTHRSGMARHDLLWFNPEFARADLVKCLQHLEPSCNLRKKFQYNNLMYAVVGILIERLLGQTRYQMI